MPSADKLAEALGRIGLEERAIPEFLNFRTAADAVFPCERKIWQTSVFAQFISKRRRHCGVTTEDVCRWLSDTFQLRPQSGALAIGVEAFLQNFVKHACLDKLIQGTFVIVRSDLPSILAASELLRLKRERAVASANRIKRAWKIEISRLRWTAEWSDEHALAARQETEKRFGQHEVWRVLLPGLLPDNRRRTPEDCAAYYAHQYGVAPENILRALALAGYVEEDR
jgi:hypothetical protein